MPNVRRGAIDSKKQAVGQVAQVDFQRVIMAAQEARSVSDLRVAVSDLASAVRVLALAAGFWQDKR